MQIPHGTVVAVADGAKFVLFHNTGDAAHPKLEALPVPPVDTHNHSSGQHRPSTDGNPADSQQEEDAFAAGTAAILNRQVLDGKIKDLVVIAAPRTLGELRRHYHKTLSAVLRAEVSKDLTGHPVADIEKAVAGA